MRGPHACASTGVGACRQTRLHACALTAVRCSCHLCPHGAAPRPQLPSAWQGSGWGAQGHLGSLRQGGLRAWSHGTSSPGGCGEKGSGAGWTGTPNAAPSPACRPIPKGSRPRLAVADMGPWVPSRDNMEGSLPRSLPWKRCWGSCANLTATARPMPEEQPVMRTVRGTRVAMAALACGPKSLMRSGPSVTWEQDQPPQGSPGEGTGVRWATAPSPARRYSARQPSGMWMGTGDGTHGCGPVARCPPWARRGPHSPPNCHGGPWGSWDKAVEG